MGCIASIAGGLAGDAPDCAIVRPPHGYYQHLRALQSYKEYRNEEVPKLKQAKKEGKDMKEELKKQLDNEKFKQAREELIKALHADAWCKATYVIEFGKVKEAVAAKAEKKWEELPEIVTKNMEEKSHKGFFMGTAVMIMSKELERAIGGPGERECLSELIKKNDGKEEYQSGWFFDMVSGALMFGPRAQELMLDCDFSESGNYYLLHHKEADGYGAQGDNHLIKIGDKEMQGGYRYCSETARLVYEDENPGKKFDDSGHYFLGHKSDTPHEGDKCDHQKGWKLQKGAGGAISWPANCRAIKNGAYKCDGKDIKIDAKEGPYKFKIKDAAWEFDWDRDVIFPDGKREERRTVASVDDKGNIMFKVPKAGGEKDDDKWQNLEDKKDQWQYAENPFHEGDYHLAHMTLADWEAKVKEEEEKAKKEKDEKK